MESKKALWGLFLCEIILIAVVYMVLPILIILIMA